MLSETEFQRYKELKKKGSNMTEDEIKEFKELSSRKGKGKGKVHYNDFDWWNRYPELMETAVSLPFNYLPGTTLFEKNAGRSNANYAPFSRIPGAVTHYYINKYGCDDDATNGCNAAFRQLWLTMHRKYRGIGTYQAADLGIVQIATIEVISLLAEIERIYGVINRYGITNRNLPYTLLEAMGVSKALADDIRLNLADFRYGINEQILKAQSMCVFKDMPIVKDKISLASNIFLDRDSDDAQAVVFALADIGVLSSTTVPTGFSVEYVRQGSLHGSWLEGISSYSGIITYLNYRIEAIVSDEDVQRIYSDMLAAFDANDLLFVYTLPEDYKVIPVYTDEIMHKQVNMYHVSGGYDQAGSDDPEEVKPNAVRMGSIIRRSLYEAKGWDSNANRAEYRITQYNNVINTRCCLYNSLGTMGLTDFDTGPLEGYVCFSNEDFLLMSHFVTDYDEGQGLLNTFVKPTDALTCEGVLWKYATTRYYNENESTYAYEIRTCGPELFGTLRYFNKCKVAGEDTVVKTSIADHVQFLTVPSTNGGFVPVISSLLNPHQIRSWSMFDWQYTIYLTEISTPMKDTSAHDVTNIGEIDNVRIVNGANIRPIHRAAFMSMYKCNLTSVDSSKK